MLDELKVRYKHSKLGARLAICALVGLIPAALLYLDESSIVDEEYERASVEEKAAADKYERADQMLKNLPKAERDLAFTREQLKKAEERLPDAVVIDEVLRSIGKSAKNYGVNIALFEPQQEIVRGDTYKYAEVPLKLSIEGGDYGQICEWLDDVAGSKSKIYLKSWRMTRKLLQSRDIASPAVAVAVEPVQGQTLSPSQILEQDGKKARENLRLVLDADVSLYKLASAVQISTAVDPANKSKGGSPTKSGNPSPGSELPQADPAAASAPVNSQDGGQL